MEFGHMLLAFNRGLISPLALGRLDVKRLALAADTHLNWMPRVLGPMSLRPGFGYLSPTRVNAPAVHLEFIFSQDDTALPELTDGSMRVRINDEIIVRPAITSTFNKWDSGSSSFIAGTETQSLFGSSGDVDLWHQNDESGALSQYVGSGNGLQLLGTGTAAAIRDRSINVASNNIGKEHCLTITVVLGLVTMRLGLSEGGDELLEDRILRVGTHSIAITPSTTYYVRLANTLDRSAIVTNVTLERGGADMVLPTIWTSSDLDNVRFVQSGDVLFVACAGRQQQRIERQDRVNNPPSRSWSVVEYAPEDGPFGLLNTGPVQLEGTGLSGDILVNSSKPFFNPGHVGALFRLTSAGQQVSQEITSQNTFTDPIKVTGVGSSGRSFQLDLTGPTFTGTTTVTLQRSVATPGTWADVASYTAVTSESIYDNLDNQIIYYRVGVKTGDFTALDDITAALTFSAGSIDGIVRVSSYVNPSQVNAAVLSPLGAANAFTQDWCEGDWSPKNGYPSGVEIADGRMAWAGKGMEWLSVTNLFDSFDDSASANLGDAGPIRRSIGSGPVDKVPWLMALNFLLLGTAGDILVAKSSSIDTPLTPTAFSLKPVCSVGAAPVRPLKIDTNGVFVSRNGARVYQLSADANIYSIVPYAPVELTELYPEIGAPGIKRVAVQRHPNTRIHCVRSDGAVVVIVFDKAEQVTCLLLVETDGLIEDAAVLPGPSADPTEDQVYYVVNRTINGATVRYLEKWATEAQTVGAVDNRMADSFIVRTGAMAGPSVFDLDYLEQKQVVVWVDGKCPLDAEGHPVLFTVDAGEIVLPSIPQQFLCIGLPYTAQWRSAKLAIGSRLQAPLNQYKNIDHIGFVLANTHARGLKYGQDFDNLDDLPMVEAGALVDPDSIWPSYDTPSMELDGTWDTDPRICLQAEAPLPCTVMAISVHGDGHDKP